jgi:hypothetical protein
MTLYIHAFLDGELHAKTTAEHLPGVGDTVRVYDQKDGREIYVKVTEVIWCYNEQSNIGERVNLRLESDK